MTLLKQYQDSKTLILSVMGPHAGEEDSAIFARKMGDIAQVGWTLWVIRSSKARPPRIQEMCDGGGVPIVFIEPSTAGGAQPTVSDSAALEFSNDKASWQAIPSGMGPVTGKMDAGAYALCLDRLEFAPDGVVEDLHAYAEVGLSAGPVVTKIGASTVCVVRHGTAGHAQAMKSRYRRVIAVGRLRWPGAVWLR